MNKHIAPIALSVGLLGIVGGIAAAHAFQPSAKPTPSKVQFVQPAADTSTPTPTTTTATPTVTVTVTPKPVQSVKAPAPAPAPVQRQAVVSETPVDPTPAPVETGSQEAARGNIIKPHPPEPTTPAP